MFTKLDQNAINLLCCPLCKKELIRKEKVFICTECLTIYKNNICSVGEYNEEIYDFRIHYPSYCLPKVIRKWEKIQKEYESFSERNSLNDSLNEYLNEIDSVKEIYTKEFNIAGTVLDVGGYQGRLRHFLMGMDIPLYVSVDPYLNAFHNISFKKNLLKAYPCLSIPCNFLAAHAEKLPFKSNSFDYVHMRSVVDHFLDPYLAFKEAFRVLRPGGFLMIGLAIRGWVKNKKSLRILPRIVNKLVQEGVSGIYTSCYKKLKIFLNAECNIDNHMFELTYQELVDLLFLTNFKINKIHWQKPPFSYCIYLVAKKT